MAKAMETGFWGKIKKILKGDACCGSTQDALEACKAKLEPTYDQASTIALIKVLGGGCAKCQALELLVRQVLANLGLSEVTLGHVRDFEQIAAYGVMSTPALVVGNKVVFSGGNFNEEVITAILKKELTPEVLARVK